MTQSDRGTSDAERDARARHRRALLGVLLVAAVMRVAFLLPAIGHPARLYTADAEEYVGLGQGFRAAYVEADDELLNGSIRRPPGYPGFLALSFGLLGDPSALSIVPHLLVSVAGVWLVFLLARRMAGPGPALWAALILAVDPLSIMYATHLQPEALFSTLLVAAALVWWRATRDGRAAAGAGAGLLLAAATFARPVSLYLPVLLVPVGIALGRARWRRAVALQLAFLLAFAAPVGAWIARNDAVGGPAVFTAIEGGNLFFQRAVAAVAKQKGISWQEAYEEVAPRVGDPDELASDPSPYAGSLASVGVRILLENPIGLLKIAWRGALATLGGPSRDPLLTRIGERDPEHGSTPRGRVLVALSFGLLALTYVGVAAGLAMLGRRRAWGPAALLLAVLAYLLAVSAGPEAYARFRMPMMPFLAVLSGCGWHAIVSWRRRAPAGLGAVAPPEPVPSS